MTYEFIEGNTNMKTMKTILAHMIVIVAFVSVPANAHHSTAAFDQEVVIKITGKVTQWRWINPHASFKVEGVSDDGYPDGLWTIEMTAANSLVRQGWKRTSLKEGDEITVYAYPLRNAITLNDGSQGGLYVGVVLADGTTLGRVDGKPLRERQ